MEGLAAAGRVGKGTEEGGLPWRRARQILKECKQGVGETAPACRGQNEKSSAKEGATGSESVATSGRCCGFLPLLLRRGLLRPPGSGRWRCAHVGEGDLGARGVSFAGIPLNHSWHPPLLIFDLLVGK